MSTATPRCPRTTDGPDRCHGASDPHDGQGATDTHRRRLRASMSRVCIPPHCLADSQRPFAQSAGSAETDLIRTLQVRILPGAVDLSVDQRRRERRLIQSAPADSATRTPIHPAKRSSDDGCIVSGSSMTMRVPRRGADAGRAGRAACVPPLSPGTRPCARRGPRRDRASACAPAGTSGTGRRSDREPSPCRCGRSFRSRARRR